jgi:hypothetical protein
LTAAYRYFPNEYCKNPPLARKDAQQAALDEGLLAQVKGIGDAGSIFEDDFKVKERAVGKRCS